MAYSIGDIFSLTHRAVQDQAPDGSGVYMVHTPRQWVYVGESANIRQALFQHLNEPSACMGKCGPLSFSFERAAAAERLPRQQALVAELAPSCNAKKP